MWRPTYLPFNDVLSEKTISQNYQGPTNKASVLGERIFTHEQSSNLLMRTFLFFAVFITMSNILLCKD